jgi:hypothetical protein
LSLGVEIFGVFFQKHAREALHSAQGRAHVVSDAVGEGFQLCVDRGEVGGLPLQLRGIIWPSARPAGSNCWSRRVATSS